MDRPGAKVSASIQRASVSGDSLAGPDSTVDRADAGAAAADELRRRWQQGERVPVEMYLQRHAALAGDEEAAIDLIYSEFLVRSERGEAPTLEEFVGRFPQYAGRLQFLLAFDEVVCDLIRAQSVTQPGPAPADAATAPTLEPAPTLIGGKYRIIELLDRGGQAEVYRALHEGLRRDVVIKLSRRPCPDESAARAGFVTEGRILAELAHPNLAAVYDLDFHEGRAFLAMEYVPGRTLDQYARGRRLPPLEAARLIAQAARAVAAAHARGVVHRDIKPKNILIDEQGRPRVIDFGLAQLHDAWRADPANEDSLSGTLAFMPPEQAADPPSADARTDVFALGAVLYYLLTGRPLYSGTDPADLLLMARRCAYDRAVLEATAIQPRLRAICLKALAPQPHDRYAGADELARDLDAFLRPAHRRQWIIGLVASVALIAAVVAGWRHFRPITYDDTIPMLTVEVHEKRPGAAIRTLFTTPTPRSGSEAKVIARVPEGFAATLFHIDNRGTVNQLESRGSNSDAPLIAPRGGEIFTLEKGDGPTTEIVIAVGRSGGPAVELSEFRDALAQTDVWLPPLPRDQYLHMLRGKVLWEPEAPRGLAPGAAAPEWAARDQLDKVREALRNRFDYIEGVAFTHR